MLLNLIIPFLIIGSVYAVEFIVQFKPDFGFDKFMSKYYQKDHSPVNVQNLKLKMFDMGHFKGIMGDFNVDTIRSFYYDKDIASISIDRELVLAEVQEYAPKHLARISQNEKLQSNQKLDYIYDPSSGIGVDVYLLDSGIDASNPDFSHRVTKIADLTGEGGGQHDFVGHGTYIAGVIGSETFGVAKKANLFDVKVANKNGRTKLSSVISALNLVLKDSKITERPTLIVIPLVMKKNAILNGAVETIVNEGIPVIVAAGNDRKQACNYSPASAKGALTVGAIDVETDSITEFSNWGACVDIFAPGLKIPTLDHLTVNGTVKKSGTSLSTGLAAGLVAYFMGMGDNGTQAIDRVINYSNSDRIPEDSLNSKPLTANKIISNKEGNPNWGPSF